MDDIKNERTTAGDIVLNLYKKQGETPRECLERLRELNPRYVHEVLSYAGRLDPMAEGVLLCLVGSANKHRANYLDLGKEYTLDILFGFSTDTYDTLGRVMDAGNTASVSRGAVTRGLNEFRGKLEQEYPPFSSKTVEGKSLIEWTRGGALGALVLPQRSVTIYHVDLEETYKVDEPTLLAYIEEGVGRVQGDFRQEEVVRTWQRFLKSSGTRTFPAATVHIECSSGTYVRSIAHELGKELGVPALALHILRTKVGEHDIKDSLR